MKIWTLFAVLTFPLAVSAIPITYEFSGNITGLNDSWESGYGLDPGFHDWWPEIGDSYSGSVTFDEETRIYDDEGLICLVGTVCGGVLDFQMQLGSGLITLNESVPHAVDAGGEFDFIAWFQAIGGNGSGYDSFFFDAGSFSGVDAAFWDGISGTANSFVRVSEPSTLALLLLTFIGIGYRRFYLKN